MEQRKHNKLQLELTTYFQGEVYFDDVSRGIYSTDASNYQVEPIAVCVPKNEEDVKTAVKIANGNGVSILPRGGGTSLSGQTVGAALILDFSKYMNKILEVNPAEKWVRVQPGLVRDELNAAMAQHGLQFAPDPATGNRANIGGMIGANSSGTRSIIYGKTVDHVLEAKVLLADGTVLQLQEISRDEYKKRMSGEKREPEIYRRFKQIIDSNRDEIEKHYPKVMRRVAGYNLDEFIHTDRWNLSKLIVGSEGTLATLLEAKLNLVPLPKYTSLCIAHFANLLESLRATQQILTFKPSAVEILDKTLLSLARKSRTTSNLCGFLQGDPEAVLIIEFYGDSPEEILQRPKEMMAHLQNQKLGYAYPIISDKSEQTNIWSVRKNGLGLLLGMRGDRKPVPFIEDACVPIEVLPEYIDQVIQICKSHKTEVILYAHASVGVLHVRPVLNLKLQEDIDKMKSISDQTFELVKKYGGSFSSEHGDGLQRGYYLEKFYGTQIYNSFKEIKMLFDPHNLMNPGKIVNSPSIDENLRYGTAYKTPKIETEFQFRNEGGFTGAVEMCSGVGACRKTQIGTMCPSYIATRDEEHSTRGRANALRLAMIGKLGVDGLTSQRLHDVLDLCLSCKACKSECPSNVDMAKLKSEFLQKYYDKHGATLRDRMIANSSKMSSRFSGILAPMINMIQNMALFKVVQEKFIGIDKRRTLPKYTSQTFHQWFANRPIPTIKFDKKVVLFDDTYLNYHEPHIGKSAVELLESCGYEVILARAGCCQRPRISHGFLRDAKRDGLKTLQGLDDYIKEGLKIVVCEPSCASALTDDLPDLIADESLGKRISENVLMIDEFLNQEIQSGRLTCQFTSPFKDIYIHGHCHQKALYGTSSMKSVLSKVSGLKVTEINSGCCGMAGSFGYEKEHYDLSLKIGEDRLFPALRSLPKDSAVISCGFSCRHQIKDVTGLKPIHWLESLNIKV